MSKADLSKQPAQVAAMFDEVSTHYDRTNTVLSMGNAALWRVATTRAVAPQAGETILDVAAGTGTSSASLARNGANVVAADFSEGMIEVGRQRQAGNPFVSFVQADATALPFDDDTFDAVTISFGLRNIVDPQKALAEFFRVLKPGGRVVICEFSRPPLAPLRAGYGLYLKYGMPLLAKAASSNPAAYEYLMESIQAWPSQPALAGWLREVGFERVAWRNLTAGIVALHRGWKPERTAAPVEANGAASDEAAPASDGGALPEAAVVSEVAAPAKAAPKKAAASAAKPKPAASAAKPKPKPVAATKPAPASKPEPSPDASAAKPKPAASGAAKPKPAASGAAKPKPAASGAAKPKPAASGAAKPKPTPAAPAEPAGASGGGARSEESARPAGPAGPAGGPSSVPSEGE
ncbi:bifunctional demethylmenaquinone methyltransferase/2-methoxy-6-polyprenyl-1,4-benzoquinol methylase UbiE [Leifsonia sp. F6_8S_P_1B]|uniref:Demethylmenaquinone methyltransferase n=1 Tax=Leifsonia williamsii TaxID=3035919 RepID=A0ABT8K991_9MICO|nr:bifunctional demethylmenaquinone methyltransferase/2-methoxy-6-polyprenyl-1,4-benzoquinol methylase UbiE [Leifsonia williamsii]MDN4614034.1 bifunctional demethylmenaquinone methyltransferase/2-methoxy-6-polyprenyl-1,4-benzoquinol methylase UbiE [Leifsonia williamsii]